MAVMPETLGLLLLSVQLLLLLRRAPAFFLAQEVAFEVDAMQRCGALVALLLLALPFFFYGRNGHGSVGVGREGTGTGVQDRQVWAGRLTIRRMAAAHKTSMLGERS